MGTICLNCGTDIPECLKGCPQCSATKPEPRGKEPDVAELQLCLTYAVLLELQESRSGALSGFKNILTAVERKVAEIEHRCRP